MNIKQSAVALVVIITLPVVWCFAPRKHGVQVYDCSISEISPDYPIEVKEGCRKLQMEKTK